jgi:hypothetical protein
MSAGWHDLELRFGEGGGGWGPSNSGGWNDQLGFGIDVTLPIEGDTQQGNYVRPVDDGSMNLFRVIQGPLVTPNFESDVTATENSAIEVVGATGARIGSVTVADGKTLTATGMGLTVNNVNVGTGGTFSMTGPSRQHVRRRCRYGDRQRRTVACHQWCHRPVGRNDDNHQCSGINRLSVGWPRGRRHQCDRPALGRQR